MLSFKRRDGLDETKPELIFLDLSETLVLTKEELAKTLSRIPNLKLKSDSIEDSVNQMLCQKSLELNTSSKSSSKMMAKNSKPNPMASNQTLLLTPNPLYERLPKLSFVDPIPESMSGLDLNDFCKTDIDWKMLTTLRPKTSQEENYFSKLVELHQLRYNTRCEDGFGLREAMFRVSRHPRVMRYKPIGFRRTDSIGFTTNDNSIDVKEDITYDAFARVPVETTTDFVSTVTEEDILLLTESLDLKLFND